MKTSTYQSKTFMDTAIVQWATFPSNPTEFFSAQVKEHQRLAYLYERQPESIEEWRKKPNILEDAVYQYHRGRICGRSHRFTGDSPKVSQKAADLADIVWQFQRYGTALCSASNQQIIDAVNLMYERSGIKTKPFTIHDLRRYRRELINKKVFYPFYFIDQYGAIHTVLASYGQDREGDFDKLLSYNKHAIRKFGWEKFDAPRHWYPKGPKPRIVKGDGTIKLTSIATTKVVHPRRGASIGNRRKCNISNGERKFRLPAWEQGGGSHNLREYSLAGRDYTNVNAKPNDEVELDRCREAECAAARERIGATRQPGVASLSPTPTQLEPQPLNAKALQVVEPSKDKASSPDTDLAFKADEANQGEVLDEWTFDETEDAPSEVAFEADRMMGNLKQTLYSNGRKDYATQFKGALDLDRILGGMDSAPLAQNEDQEAVFKELGHVEGVELLGLTLEDAKDVRRQINRIGYDRTRLLMNVRYVVNRMRMNMCEKPKGYLVKAYREDFADQRSYLAQDTRYSDVDKFRPSNKRRDEYRTNRHDPPECSMHWGVGN